MSRDFLRDNLVYVDTQLLALHMEIDKNDFGYRLCSRYESRKISPRLPRLAFGEWLDGYLTAVETYRKDAT